MFTMDIRSAKYILKASPQEKKRRVFFALYRPFCLLLIPIVPQTPGFVISFFLSPARLPDISDKKVTQSLIVQRIDPFLPPKSGTPHRIADVFSVFQNWDKHKIFKRIDNPRYFCCIINCLTFA